MPIVSPSQGILNFLKHIAIEIVNSGENGSSLEGLPEPKGRVG
jgi:hypothetical protein